eukprot:SAG11_NODE_20407_length_446_cov_0.587896_2_plen_30_part_01
MDRGTHLIVPDCDNECRSLPFVRNAFLRPA